MKKLVFLFVLVISSGVFSQSVERNSFKLAITTGFPTGIGSTLIYGNEINSAEFTLYGWLDKLGAQAAYKRQVFVYKKLKNHVSFFAGLDHGKWEDNTNFFRFLHTSDRPVIQTLPYRDSWYGGIAYSGVINRFSFKLGAAWGNNNFEQPRFIYQFNYLFDL